MMRLLPICLTLALAGCAQSTWKPRGITDAEFTQDQLECQHELAIARASFSMALTFGGHSAAMAQMEADPAASGMVESDLMRLCLIARGYRQLDMQQVTAIQQYVPLPPAIDSVPVRLSRTEKIEWVRMIADKHECVSLDELTAAEYVGGRELYSLACTDGRTLALACDFSTAVHEVNGTPMILGSSAASSRPACLMDFTRGEQTRH